MEDASSLSVNDKIVIVAKDYDFALSTTQNSNNRGQAAVTKDGNTVSFDETTQIITLEEGATSGTFAFNVGTGYLYAASTSSNHLKTEDNISENGSWTITISNGVATIKSVGNTSRGWIRYNATNTNPGPIFSCYGTGQTDVAIYKEGSVVKKEIKTLSCEGTPTKTSYIEGQSFDPTGLTINVTYSDDTPGTLAASALTWSPEVLTVGTTSVTGTYGEFSVTVNNITVNAMSNLGFPVTSNAEIMEKVPTAGDVTEESFFALGIVVEVQSTTYGNLLIKDANGDELLIYGTYLDSKANENRYDAMETKPVEGDVIMVYGIAKNYNGTKELVDTLLVSLNGQTTTEVFKLIEAVINADTCNDYALATDYEARYDALSDDHKAIFDGITINCKANESDTELSASVNLLEKLNYMVGLNASKQAPAVESNLLSSLKSVNKSYIVLFIGLLGLTAILGYYFINKKKYAR